MNRATKLMVDREDLLQLVMAARTRRDQYQAFADSPRDADGVTPLDDMAESLEDWGETPEHCKECADGLTETILRIEAQFIKTTTTGKTNPMWGCWYPIPETGNYFRVVGWEGKPVLLCAPMLSRGTDPFRENDIELLDDNGAQVNAGEVTAPDSQETLDKVNAIFGTDFMFDQFAGR